MRHARQILIQIIRCTNYAKTKMQFSEHGNDFDRSMATRIQIGTNLALPRMQVSTQLIVIYKIFMA